MTIADTDRWAIAGVGAATTILVLNPLLFYGVNWLINVGSKRQINVWTLDGAPYTPTVYAFLIHVLVLFFLLYMFLAVIDWQCSL